LEQHSVKNSSGVTLCLHKYQALGMSVGTVILAHGMFSNYRTCGGIASYLAALNYDCWLLDFQGHGFSENPDNDPNFESMCLEDTETALLYIHDMSKTPVWWIGHSGGGLAILMYLARYPRQQDKLAGIVALGSQATDASLHWRRQIIFKLLRILIRLKKSVPGKIFRLGPENENASVLDQWFWWNISKRWVGSDGFEYLSKLGNIFIPGLMIAGKADKFIAPASGCRKLHDSLSSSDKTFLLFAKRNGHLEDYTHGRLISSRNASIDVWPLIGEWLQLRTPRSNKSKT